MIEEIGRRAALAQGENRPALLPPRGSGDSATYPAREKQLDPAKLEELVTEMISKDREDALKIIWGARLQGGGAARIIRPWRIT